jgi:hypothetical protein
VKLKRSLAIPPNPFWFTSQLVLKIMAPPTCVVDHARTAKCLSSQATLPDLDQAKSAVLNSLTSADAQRGYRHAIEEFVEWYTARGLAKSYGERLRGCNVRNMNPEKAEGLSPELQAALQPLLAALESLSERIAEYNERIEKLAQESYPQVALLKQVKGVGTLIALTFLLTLEDPHRFRKSRDVGCYLGLQPGRRNSGQSEPQLHISKEGDPYLRTLLVQGAHHILGPFGADSDLRRWGLKLAERGGKSGKKRAIIATARKLAVLLHHLWVSGEEYQPLHNSRERPTCTERTKSLTRVRMEGWRQWLTRPEKKPCPTKKQQNPLDSDRPSHGRRLCSLTCPQPERVISSDRTVPALDSPLL